MIDKLWEKLSVIHAELQEDYYSFSKKKIKQLERDFEVDCGIDYADHIFAISGLLKFYTGNKYKNGDNKMKKKIDWNKIRYRIKVNQDIVYLIDDEKKVIGKIDFTMKKIQGEIFQDFKRTKHFN